jgi:serine/threonine protein phosphatase PrpC
MNSEIDYCCIQLNKNEDFITRGQCVSEEGESFQYIIVLDGHGDITRQMMPYVRGLDFDSIMCHKCPATYLNDLLNEGNRFHIRAGCTFACAKIFDNRVESITVGDSNVYIYVNNELVYLSPDHNITNSEEIQRLEEAGITYKTQDDQTFKLISPTSLAPDMSQSIHFLTPTPYIEPDTGCELFIAMTQTLGHHGITGLKPYRKTILFQDTDKVDVIVATDGVWDIIDPELIAEDKTMILQASAKDIAKEAANRWRQGWNYIYNGHTYPNTEFGPVGWDDISVGVYRKGRNEELFIAAAVQTVCLTSNPILDK